MTGESATMEPLTASADPAVASALARATRWRVLSLLLGPPRPGLGAVLGGLAFGAESLPTEDRAIVLELASAAEADPESLWAHHHRVLGPGGHCPAGETDLLPSPLGAKGGPLGDIAGFYRAFRFDPDAEWREAPDHAATECAFAAWLELKVAYARARGATEDEAIVRDGLERFLATHLRPCLAVMVPRLAEVDGEGFYGRVALLAR